MKDFDEIAFGQPSLAYTEFIEKSQTYLKELEKNAFLDLASAFSRCEDVIGSPSFTSETVSAYHQRAMHGEAL
jgi:hypothetical protein